MLRLLQRLLTACDRSVTQPEHTHLNGPTSHIFRTKVQEVYLDIVPVAPDVFHLNMAGSLHQPLPASSFRRTVDGLLASLLALQLEPTTIRFSASSPISHHVALEVEKVCM